MKLRLATLMLMSTALFFLFSASAWADSRQQGYRGRANPKSQHQYKPFSQGHHPNYAHKPHYSNRYDNDRHYRYPYYRPYCPPGPRYYPYPHHGSLQGRHYYHRPYRYYPSSGYGFSGSFYEPGFSFSFSTGNRW